VGEKVFLDDAFDLVALLGGELLRFCRCRVGSASSIAAAKSIAVRGLDFMFTVLLRDY